MTSRLRDKLAHRESGIALYGFAPPKLATAPERLAAIVASQLARLGELGPDGMLVYDIQDEADRTLEPRPFPFLPTLDPEAYAEQHLAPATLDSIVYRCVSHFASADFVSWLEQRAAKPNAISVLVGAPTGNTPGALPLGQAYALAREHAPELMLGGIAIAERHIKKLDEHERMLGKARAGCRFFVTQAVYDVSSTKSLLSDYALALTERAEPALPIIVTLSPCGSEKTLAFMKWLGISFPRWLENELRSAADPLTISLDLCETIFAEVWDYARSKQIPLGVNVESVSIRKAEIDASVELFRRLRRRMK